VPIAFNAYGSRKFSGRIDWIARERSTGATWVWEFKTRKTLTPDTDEQYDLQKALYQHVASVQYKLPITGAITLQGLTVLPRVPSQNKDGSMSRKPIKTTWPIYRSALLQARLDPANYDDMRVKLADQRFVQLDRSYRSAEYCSTVWHVIALPIARQMTGMTESSAIPAVHPLRCNRCEYKDLCTAVLNGHDSEYIRQTQFSVRRDT
jgi:hypothetical protein